MTAPASTASARTAPLTNAERLKAIVGGSAGNLVEWYDWFIYAYLALYFAPTFFPAGDETAQLLRTAAIFAVGFFARPVGAWMMGLYADRAGRRAAMTLSVAMMCAGSLVIALTPGFDEIGAAAPAILLAARILQGLSVGGEYGASATYLSEVATRARRGFWSSFHYVTLVFGQVLAIFVVVLLERTIGPEALAEGGWRIPFYIGAALAVVVFWVRLGIQESASFTRAKIAGETKGTRAVFAEHPRATFTIIGLTAAGSLVFYAYAIYMQKFLTLKAGFTRPEATGILAAALVFFMAMQPLVGWLSDKVGRKRMLVGAFGIGALLPWPVFTAIEALGTAGAQPALIAAILMGAFLVQSGYSSVSAVIKAELFPAGVRALGVALPYALANALFGGTAEFVALWFDRGGFAQGFYLYVSGVSLFSFLVALSMHETRDRSEILED